MNPTAILPKTGLGSTAETNRLLGGNYFNTATGTQIQQFTPKTSISQTFDANALANQIAKPFNVPPSSNSTLATGLTGTVQGLFDASALVQKEQEKIDKAQKEKDSAQGGIKDTMTRILGLQAGRGEEEEQAGIPQMTQDVNKANQDFLMSQRAEVNELRALNERQDISLDVKSQVQGSIQRKYAFQQADNALKLSLARQDLATAQEILNKKYELQMEPLRDILEFQKFFYQENSEDLSKAEQNKLQLMIAENEREYKFQIDEYNKVGEIALLAGQNGAPASVVTSVSNAKTQREAIQQASSYLRDLPKGLGSVDGSTTGPVSNTTQAIIDNPSLFDDLTPTVRGQVLQELQAQGFDTSNLGVKGLSDTAIGQIAQTQKALSDLGELKATIEGKTEMLGPITGLARFNPYSSARKLQADVDRVRQTVGKALEGGVLRKEDEDKYKKILATLADTPSTAIYKIDALIGSIQRDIESYKTLQQGAGRSLNVSGSLQKKGTTNKPEDLRTKYNY